MRTVLPSLVWVIALGACGDAATPPSAGGGAGRGAGSSAPVERGPAVRVGPTPTVLTAPPIVLPTQESFTLVTPGTGARSPLRYPLVAGASEYRALLTLTTRRLEAAALSAPRVMAPIQDGFAVVVAAGAPLGVRALEAVIQGTDAERTKRAEAYVAAARRNLKDRRASVGLDDRGLLGAITFNDDPTGTRGPAASDELAQRLLTLAVPFPAEPLGVGAQWRVVTILRQGPLYLKQTATYELLARTAATARVKVKLVRHGEPQLVTDATLPPDTVAELVALVRILEGELQVDTTRPFAVGGALSVESRLHARITTPNQPAVDQIVEDLGSLELSAPPVPP